MIFEFLSDYHYCKSIGSIESPNFNGSSAAESSAKSATLPSNVADKRGEKEKTTNAEDRVKLIESFAKDAIKHYKRSITVEEYKNVMRAVVRECYKKKILDGDKIKEKVNEFVRAVKNGEQLSEHHSSKRSETSGEHTSIVPVKRQKCEA
ncbi:hypothetical protein NECAME_05870 [Necator americanus]|uniref:Set2 Rpb1 interacting domain-containing protein n=1 Tax=Necator americanus TaxID=51031 RepID=W2TYD8_NECAM|nr:hypothetical protein NECAME_05870 [Necator americanus]ETN86694.1 hypothetical protein NECAME_05870 [Necator americanus]